VNRSRWLRRIALYAGAVAAIAILCGATYEGAMRRRVMRVVKVPGRLVDVGGGRRIQIDCRGSGSPTVVLESGLDAYGSLSWAAVHDSIATTSRVCAYSRAGIMWSDAATNSFTSEGVARDLHAALIGAGEVAPWVVVGHSLGGPYILTFTKLYSAEVVGLVFVDATHPHQFARFRVVAEKSLQPTEGAVALGDALSWTGLVRLLPVGGTPASWPIEVGRVAPAFLPTSIHPLRREIGGISETLKSAGAATALGDRPLVVLTAGRAQSPDALQSMGLTAEQGVRLAAVSRALHDDQTTWSSRGRQEIVEDASHYIQFDRPDVVIRAVRDVLDAARRSRTVHLAAKQ
jgi:pimeloyl-ACP methyl ester carboxylesterase